MKTMSSRGAIAVIALITCSAAAPGEEPAPPTGTVELKVRSSNSQPLANHTVEITPDQRFYHFEKPASKRVTTDQGGTVRFPWPLGVHRFRVEVKGVGYGATGTFELLEQGMAQPALPPLVPFAVIEGTVPKDFLKPETLVTISESNDRDEKQASCDAQGRFTLVDVPCGGHWLRVRAGNEKLPVEAWVLAAPGQRVKQVAFRKIEREFSRPDAPNGAAQTDRGKEITWAAGTVRDMGGRSVESAAVFAIVTYHGGIRMYQTIESTKTDKHGSWEIKGRGDLSMFSGHVLVFKRGYPPVVIPLPDPMGATAIRASRSQTARNLTSSYHRGAVLWKSRSGRMASHWRRQSWSLLASMVPRSLGALWRPTTWLDARKSKRPFTRSR